MKMEIREFVFPQGKFKYYLDECKNAVLVDYVGDAEILCIPKGFDYLIDDGDDTFIFIGRYIPDESFQSCKNVKTVIFHKNTDLGLLLFANCPNLSNIVCIDSDIRYEEFTFVNENNTPKNVKVHHVLSSYQEYIGGGEYMPSKIERSDALFSLAYGFAKNNDHDKISEMIWVEDFAYGIGSSVAFDDVETLRRIEALGIDFGVKSPFTIVAARALRSGSMGVLDFLLERKIFTADYECGSLLYAAVDSGRIDLVKKVLDAGASPFSLAPEWLDEKFVYDVAYDRGRVDMAELILAAAAK